jgi:hypothetical protein
VAKLSRIKDPSSIDHDRLRHVFNEVVGREGFEPFPLGYDDAAVHTGQTGRGRICAFERFKPFV